MKRRITLQSKLTQILQRATEGAYGEDSEIIGKSVGIILAAKFYEHGAGPFICGIVGEPGTDDLADAYHICPRYGADVQYTRTYVRSDPGGFSPSSMRHEDWL